MRVTVFSAQAHKHVYHTRECQIIRNKPDANTKTRDRDEAEQEGYRECKYCSKEVSSLDTDEWRPSLRRLIEKGEIEIE